jgi:hypothetical protein
MTKMKEDLTLLDQEEPHQRAIPLPLIKTQHQNPVAEGGHLSIPILSIIKINLT